MKELAGRLAKLNDMINAEFPAFANNLQIGVGLGMTAFAAIKTRIQKTGQAADGGTYKPYSTKPTLIGASSFRTKTNAERVFGSKKKRQAMEWRTVDTNKGARHLAILKGGYKEIRILDRQQADHKDFTRTTEMWNSIHVEGTRQEGQGKFITTVGTENELSNKKLEGNTKREGKEILACTKGEEQMLNELLDVFITKLVNRAING